MTYYKTRLSKFLKKPKHENHDEKQNITPNKVKVPIKNISHISKKKVKLGSNEKEKEKTSSSIFKFPLITTSGTKNENSNMNILDLIDNIK